MRILLVNDFGFHVGGAEAYTFGLGDKLRERGHEVGVLSSDMTKWRDFPNERFKATFTCSGVGKDRHHLRELFNIKAYLQARRVIGRFRPDIVHLNNILYQLTPSILASLDDIPAVMTLHDYYAMCISSNRLNKKGEACTQPFGYGCVRAGCKTIVKYPYQWLKKRAHRRLLRRVSLFIAPSDFMKEMAEMHGLSPVRIVYNGIDLASIKASQSEGIGVLYVGQLSEIKGVDYLIKAMPRVSEEVGAKLTIVGGGSERKNLEKLVKRLRLEEVVEFLGRVPNGRLREVWSGAGVTAVPSIWPENCPMVILESFALGKPVVATNVGGNPELVEDGVTGYLVEPRNPDQLADRLVGILANGELAERMGQSARKKAESDFDMNRHVAKIERIYEELLHRKRQGHRNG